MKQLDLSEQELHDIDEAIDSPETKQRFRRKLLVVKMVAHAAKRELIVQTLNISHPTLLAYIEEYKSGGLSRLLEDRSYKPTSCIHSKMDQLREAFEQVAPTSAKQAGEYIKERFGVSFSLSQVRRILKTLGMKFIKAGSVPGKADGQMQLDFLKGLLEPRIEQARHGELKLYFLDASHFLWGAHPGYSWCFKRLQARGACGRRRYNVLGAVDPINGHIEYLESEETITAESVASLLLDLRFADAQQPICVVLDNVPYHRARLVREIAHGFGIELLYLPAYSPNLNLIERLWKWVKKHSLQNQWHESYEQFITSIRETLQRAQSNYDNEVKSLLTLNFQILDS